MKSIFATDNFENISEKIMKTIPGQPKKSLLQLADELKAVEDRLVEVISDTDDSSVKVICDHILCADGKRLRPALVFLAGQFGNYNVEKLVSLGTAIEVLHTATLIHDDIIDNADLRRGFPTINKKWDADTAILMGDYLYGKTLTLLADLGKETILAFSEIVTKLTEGEIQQKANLFNPKVSLEDYQLRIHNKTAFFISQCCRLGALVCDSSESDTKLLADYGESLGIAFQIQDDLMDFTEEATSIGKPVNEDLRKGILTLPIIYILNVSNKKDELEKLISSGDINDNEWNLITEEIRKTGAIEYSKKLARYYSGRARESISTLKKCPGQESLEFLTYFVTERKK